MKKGAKNTRGFTIIEVSLVLAIGGLIFLMVFVALPALRRQQRDTDRREDIISFLETVKKYQTNNRGALPGGANAEGTYVAWGSVDGAKDASRAENSANTWEGFYHDYLGEKFKDPYGDNYRLVVMRCDGENCGEANVDLWDASFPNDYKLNVILQATCSGENAVPSSNPRKLAVRYIL